jgi:hypothetical protein
VKTFATRIGLVAGLAVFAGCSSRSIPAGDVAGAPVSIVETNELLKAATGALGHPPTKVADLDKHQSLFPRAYAAIKSGDILVLWGVQPKGEGDIARGGETVVAYEKNVPTEGGYVLFSAGTIKKMTAAEFSAAPKAGKS